MSPMTTTKLASVLLTALLMSTFVAVPVNSQSDLMNYCGTQPCIEPVRMSCDEMMERYEFQGSCCSLAVIPQTGGCRITVSFGNCFWYPWCGTCEEDEEIVGRCNNIFETDANQRPCPVGDFDPVEIQQSENFTQPSCSPSMAPTDNSDSENGERGGGGSSSGPSRMGSPNNSWWASVVTTGITAVVVATVVAAVMAA